MGQKGGGPGVPGGITQRDGNCSTVPWDRPRVLDSRASMPYLSSRFQK
jgi:hypothetical protein